MRGGRASEQRTLEAKITIGHQQTTEEAEEEAQGFSQGHKSAANTGGQQGLGTVGQGLHYTFCWTRTGQGGTGLGSNPVGMLGSNGTQGAECGQDLPLK